MYVVNCESLRSIQILICYRVQYKAKNGTFKLTYNNNYYGVTYKLTSVFILSTIICNNVRCYIYIISFIIRTVQTIYLLFVTTCFLVHKFKITYRFYPREWVLCGIRVLHITCNQYTIFHVYL